MISIEEIKNGIIEAAEDNETEVVFLDGFDGGLIGFQELCGEVHAVYDEDKMLSFWALINNCSMEEAIEWYEFNTLRSLPYIDEKTRPIIIHNLS